MTEEKKYSIGGYAPGHYQCQCCICGNGFIGDKRAVQCEPCAVKGEEWYNALSNEEKKNHLQRNIEAFNNLIEGNNQI